MEFNKTSDENENNICNSIKKIQELLEICKSNNLQEKLNKTDIVNYDLFVCFLLNTLYWIYLRTKGIDPNNNDIKNEFIRIKNYMSKNKEIKEKLTLRPKLNINVGKRFIRNSLFDPGTSGASRTSESAQPPHKKRRIN